MKTVKVLLLFFVFTCCQTVNAQNDFDELVQKRHRFSYQGKIYSQKEIGAIFQRKEEANEVFKASVSIYKKANIAGVTSLGLIGIGIGGVVHEYIFATCSFATTCPKVAIVAIGLIGGCVAGSAGIAMKMDANSKMRNSVRLFNEDLDAMGRIGKYPLELNIGNTQNGVGMVLRF